MLAENANMKRYFSLISDGFLCVGKIDIETFR